MSSTSAAVKHVSPIVCIGEALVDLFTPQTTDHAVPTQITPRIGGAPANMSVAITRIGGNGAFLGCLADDLPGTWIDHRLRAEDVDVSRVRVVENAQTRMALVTGPADARDFAFYGHPAADTLLTPEDIDAANLATAGAVILSSLALTGEPGRSAMHRALEVCTETGTPIIFDPNPRRKTWPDPEDARKQMLPFIRAARVLKLGAEEPDILGLSIEAIRAHQPPRAALIITDGPRGCRYWYGDERSALVAPFPVDAVDSTGAGDAFTAALALRFVECGGNIGHADVEFASAAGALTTTRQGAMDALPSRAGINDLLEATGRNW